jgi:hypothetical protein
MQDSLPSTLGIASFSAALVLFAGQISASTFSFPPVSQGTVTDPAIVEASGLVASPDNPGVLWTENDSGNPNTIFALDTNGNLLGTYYLDGVTNYDWEDMSVGPGPEPGINYLYLANSASREVVNQSIVVRVPEPTVYASQQVANPVTVHLSGTLSQTFVWAAPTPDAETMFVDRQDGDIYLGSKQSGSTIVDLATQTQFSASGAQTMTQAGSVPLNKGNGASISPDGTQILIRNQKSTALLYHRSPGQTVAQALANPHPDSVTINGTDVEPDAEAIAFDANGNNFYTFSEGLNQKLYLYTRTSHDAPIAPISLLAPAATWKYLDGGAAPASGWNQSGFNDSSWSSGSGPFGYGQGNEHTLLSYGTNPNDKPASDVFRTTFTVTNPHLLTDLTLKLLVDDGAAVYLNGTQIDRFNLAAGATLTNFSQSSVSNAFQNSWRTSTFAGNLLVAGTNTIAVEVHGSAPTDNDLRFDAQITAVPITPTLGDFNLDGQVDSAEIASMLSAMTNLNEFQTDNGLSNTDLMTIADVNRDGKINNADVQALINKLLSGGGSAAPVPEPQSFVLALMAIAGLTFANRRGTAHRMPANF